ncbi:TetR/AcrR family transcriptional regulator [Ramlibacter sp. AN1133]|uniref:TetR/AcrR family transcriptional regulator n=1 Tax=Ramlibacter sp. AN1133 TaxID=3133429 RepID=UPI0030BBCA09
MQSEAQVARSAILEVALQLAERSSWDAIHLFDVAREMGVGLADIQRHFPNKDSLTEAWFDVADAALLRLAQTPGWQQVPQRQRLQFAYTEWLDTLAPHRRLTREMLGYRLQPEHVHLQARGVMRTSDTVQWIREVALLPHVGWRREVAETVLTTIFLAVFAFWLFDESPQSRRTQALLGQLLRAADFGSRLIVPGRRWKQLVGLG